jgi:1-aminocyclopropane-1-carboxylate deaminase/D-cysteine desulfhydrase-like pyridoxal-dependent ACC family enzyme
MIDLIPVEQHGDFPESTQHMTEKYMLIVPDRKTEGVVLTPVERHGNIWIKRDDLFEVAGCYGGKARTCYSLAQEAKKLGYSGLVTASARTSPQSAIVAKVARYLGLTARCHMPTGGYTEMMMLAEASGAEIIQHKAGYNTVIIRHALEDARVNRLFDIPFGMRNWEAVTQTREQVANVPPDVKRIVVTVGSAMSACGILHGLRDYNRNDIEVLGVVVGADPVKRLDAFGTIPWRKTLTLVRSPIDYHDSADNILDGIYLDPYYEAKCIPFLQQEDLFWDVGIRPPK